MFASHEFTSHGIHSTFTKSLDGDSVRAAFRRRRRIFTEFSRDTVSYATAFHMSWLSRRAIFSVVPLGAAFRVHLVSSKQQEVASTLYAERDRASFPENLLGKFRFTIETSWDIFAPRYSKVAKYGVSFYSPNVIRAKHLKVFLGRNVAGRKVLDEVNTRSVSCSVYVYYSHIWSLCFMRCATNFQPNVSHPSMSWFGVDDLGKIHLSRLISYNLFLYRAVMRVAQHRSTKIKGNATRTKTKTTRRRWEIENADTVDYATSSTPLTLCGRV